MRESLELPREMGVLFVWFSHACLRSATLYSEVFQLDFLELYAGTARLSRAMAREGCRVNPPIELKSGWDLDKELFALILHLSSKGRIG